MTFFHLRHHQELNGFQCFSIYINKKLVNGFRLVHPWYSGFFHLAMTFAIIKSSCLSLLRRHIFNRFPMFALRLKVAFEWGASSNSCDSRNHRTMSRFKSDSQSVIYDRKLWLIIATTLKHLQNIRGSTNRSSAEDKISELFCIDNETVLIK